MAGFRGLWVLPWGWVLGDGRAHRGKSLIKIFLKGLMTLPENINNPWVKLSNDGRILINSSRTALILRISEQTLATWTKKGCPKESRGWYDISAVVAWRYSGDIDTGNSVIAEKLDADKRLKVARATLAEQELKLKSGQLLNATLVEQELTEIFDNLKASMLAIGDHIMSEMYSQYPEMAPQVRRLIDGYIRTALKTAAENRGKLPERAGHFVKKPVGRPRKRSK